MYRSNYCFIAGNSFGVGEIRGRGSRAKQGCQGGKDANEQVASRALQRDKQGEV